MEKDMEKEILELTKDLSTKYNRKEKVIDILINISLREYDFNTSLNLIKEFFER